jgi:hypothetical protein
VDLKLIAPAATAAKLEQIELPAVDFVSHEEWKQIRPWRMVHHEPWHGAPNPLDGIEGVIRHPVLPVEFKTHGKEMIPVSWATGQQDYTIDLKGKNYRKLYLLVVPFLDSHDMFAPVGRILTTKTDGRIIPARTLRFPGDLDWQWPQKKLGLFATYRGERTDRFGLLPQLGKSEGDWDELSTPAHTGDWNEGYRLDTFPQPAFWASCLPIDIDSATLNIIEVNLRKSAELKSLTLSTIGTEPAFGLIGVVGELDNLQAVAAEKIMEKRFGGFRAAIFRAGSCCISTLSIPTQRSSTSATLCTAITNRAEWSWRSRSAGVAACRWCSSMTLPPRPTPGSGLLILKQARNNRSSR